MKVAKIKQTKKTLYTGNKSTHGGAEEVLGG